MSKTWLFNSDQNGTDSINSIIAKNQDSLTVIEVGSYEKFDNISKDLLEDIVPGDLVILDTISMLADTTRTDYKLGTDMTKSYWKDKDRLVTDAVTRNIYGAAGALIMRRLKNFRSMGARIIVTAHERSGYDPNIPKSAKIRIPDVNDDLCKSLTGSSSLVCRLTINHDEVTDEEGNVLLAVGQRLLQIKPSEDYYTKVHMDLESSYDLPDVISRPSTTKLAKILGHEPAWMTLYGPPGAGKTTFALSHYLDPEGLGIGK